MKTILEENRILEFYATKGGTICDKWPLLPTKGQIYAAAALIIFFCQNDVS